VNLIADLISQRKVSVAFAAFAAAVGHKKRADSNNVIERKVIGSQWLQR
jgi:hypothetical protein